MPGICGTPPLATVFIIFAACSNRCTSWLTSVTVVPEPFAMRRRREPFSSFGIACARPSVIDWMIASVRTISRSSKFSSCSRMPPAPGSMPSIPLIEPMFRSCCICGEEVVERERVGRELLGDLRRLVLVEGLLRLLDEGEDVAEVEDAARHAVGVERLEVVEALTGGREHDRAAGDGCDGERRATARVAVELGEHDAREVDALLEGLRRGRPRPDRSSRR